MNYLNDEINLNKINAKIIKKINQFKIDSTEKIVDYFNSYILNLFSTNNPNLKIFSNDIKDLMPTDIPYPITFYLNKTFEEFLDKFYLSELKQKYLSDIFNKRDNIVEDINKLLNNRILQLDLLSKKSENSAFNNIENFTQLNETLNNIDYKFTFNFFDYNKELINNILLNSTLKNYLIKIPNDFSKTLNETKNNIINNVKLDFNFSKDLEQYLNIINDYINLNKEMESIKKEFLNKFSILYENLENEVLKYYNEQTSPHTTFILPIISNKRKLKENINEELKELKYYINFIDFLFINFTQNISNSEGIINITNKFNQINNILNIQLLNLENTMNSYINYLNPYLNSSDSLNEYKCNKSKIYNEVQIIFKNFLNSQTEKINDINNSLNNYKDIYFDEIKPKILEKINNVIKYFSKEIISQYLKNEINNGSEMVDLSNLGNFNFIIGSSIFNCSIDIKNFVLKWGYNFTIDPNNYKVYLNLYSGGYSDFSISYFNEFYKSSTEGKFGNGIIGMNIINDFSINDVFIDYYIKYYNNSVTKTLYELNTLDSLESCENENECFVTKNKEYCPYNINVTNGDKIIFNPSPFDSEYYKNSNIYIFTGEYENNLCTYSNYLFEIEEFRYEFNSTTSRTA